MNSHQSNLHYSNGTVGTTASASLSSRTQSVPPFGSIGARDASLPIAMIHGCRIFQECLEQALRVRAPNIGIQCFESVDEFAADLTASSPYALILLYMGSRASGEDTTREEMAFLKSRLSVPLVVLAEGDGIDSIKLAIDAGAQGYIAMNMALSAAVEALQMVRAGGMFIPASCISSYHRPEPVLPKDLRFEADALFTNRQAAVVRALRQGMANKRIAYELNMRESTVKVHVRNIMRKLNARNRTEVAFRTNALFADEDLVVPAPTRLSSGH
ncbi:LuxR C-terminal-related transcriptional regulator [Aureimonas sp. AU40]|uniref:LuxR C-terminal-related transcriptional regulator n=1 Tax=Aureimonas sp. AU40 TaxID=1637747 RepID=UPI000B12A5CF|nr:response regulator transcription factor [Aureimonas sp. AU40]